MSLYLTIFDGDKELAGWCLGHYSDFGFLRDIIGKKLRATDYPLMMTHSDCDGQWSPEDLPRLQAELRDIAERFKKMPPINPQGAFEHTSEYRSNPVSLFDCFHNVDGENLFEALNALCEEGIRHNRSILFQ